MDPYRPIGGVVFLFLIYSTIGLVAWGFRARFMSGRFEFCFPRRKPWVAFMASSLMLASMGLAFFFHWLGYELILVSVHAEGRTFLEAIPEMYSAKDLWFAPVSSGCVIVAALLVGMFVNRYDSRHA